MGIYFTGMSKRYGIWLGVDKLCCSMRYKYDIKYNAVQLWKTYHTYSWCDRNQQCYKYVCQSLYELTVINVQHYSLEEV